VVWTGLIWLRKRLVLQAGKTTAKNRHTQETKGTNEHDKKEKKKKRNSNLLENKY
jgi:hypothetical protein